LDYGGDIADVLAELLRALGAITTIRDRYFGGRPILFRQDDVKLSVLIAEVEEMAHLYNELFDAIERAGGQDGLPRGGQDLPSKLDVARLRLAATNCVAAEVRFLVTMAESGAHAALGHGKLATEILMSEFKGNQP
jgi:hypothetical protein